MRWLIGTVWVLFLAEPAFGEGRKIRVPRDYPNIQTAINFADDGDVVIVSDGVWTGSGNKNIDFLGLAITVRSKKGPENCIIDCEGDGRGFWFHSNETEASVVDGFTITNGLVATGGGIYCSSSPTITNCIITGNREVGGGGGGLYFGHSSDATITNCIITDNRASAWGAGIYSYASSLTITNCTIANNSLGAGEGGGIQGYSSDLTITNCTISGNRAYLNNGGGLYIGGFSHVTITNCIITDNRATYDGGGIYSYASSLTITNCIITDNRGGSDGGGIWWNKSDLTITNCTISGNRARRGNGGGVYNWSLRPKIINSILWGNKPNEIEGESSVSFSDIRGGWPGEGNIDKRPRFTTGPLGDFYLSHKKAGQDRNSPCINAGLGIAKELGLKKTTTRTDGKKDKKAVDMGYHYPR